ncbi:lysophospholipase L1 [Gottschalkia purinilytica]|uniref:Lysophospholipase L1 n=1 Tax=Gottschalkia purinilytica TaxID=1503 RepID=A0A0L0WAR6_GOTPU|nr:GDSL-type esterase/lipase family protein [Gottschalkia purinilytica]KNF08586.1 lysophospholipase L1 [Gottschalkia purinilytica]
MRKKKSKKKIKINPKRFITSMIVLALMLSYGISSVMSHSTGNKNDKVETPTESNSKDNNLVSEDLEEEPQLKWEVSDNETDSFKEEDTELHEQDDKNSEVSENDDNKNGQNIQDINIPNKEFFKNDVFMGDSITESISFYEVLNDKNVLGIKGLTAVKAKSHIDSLISKKPRNIYMLFGMNDIESGISTEQFKKGYRELVTLIKERLPNSNIYLQSMLPVDNKVLKKNSNYSRNRMDQFNNVIKELAQEENLNYINLLPVIENNINDFYEPDGIHPKSKFYKIWLDYVKNNIN